MAGWIHTRRNRSPFRSLLLQLLFNLTDTFLRPFFICLNGVLGPIFPTTPEQKSSFAVWRNRVLISPLYLLGLFVVLIPSLIVYIVKNFLHLFRDTYCLSFASSRSISVSHNGVDRPIQKSRTIDEPVRYTAVTANVCLLPEFMARYNNLNNTMNRAVEIGERIVTDQVHFRRLTQKYSKSSAKSSYCSNSSRLSSSQASFDVNIISHFTHTDVLCLQETFDRDYSTKLLSELHKVFPWIVFDAVHSHKNKRLCGLTSGLMVASRYEFMAVRFKPFSDWCGFCTLTNKGLLMTKVNLNTCTSDGQQKVGYVFNTHLQAFQGTKPIVQSQLSEILKWTEEFRRDTHESEECVAFDILCGDFNVDNMSPGEAAISRHDLFKEYVDVARVRPGQDHDWTVGTEFRNALLYDPDVSDPEGLKACLEDPHLRQRYIIDADLQSATLESIYNPSSNKDEQGNTVLSPVGGKRRIDLVLYRKECPVDVQNYNFVTRLARLTDHIPVSMTFTSQK